MSNRSTFTIRHFAIRYFAIRHFAIHHFAIRYSLFALFSLSLACAQSLDEPLNPVFPSRFTAAMQHEGYVEYRVEFPSAFVSSYAVNNTVYARWLVPKAPSRLPAVVLLHSLGILQPTLELALARELVRHHIAVLLLTLPYHMERTPPGYGSGDLVLEGDVSVLRQTLIQAVWDVRRAIDWLARQPEVDGTRIGLVGISLGAILGATVLGVEPRLHSAVLILGGVDVAHIVWHSLLAIRTRIRLREQGYTLPRLREAIADVEPMYRLTPELGAKTFVIGARFDLVVPTEDTEKLIRALGNPRVFWLNTGHFGGALVQRPLFRMVRRYLVARFAGEVPPIESSPFVPTVRIGAIYSAERDFRLAVGVDFWRSDKHGTLFLTGVLTPRGGSLFAGVRLRLGFSAGIEITARRNTGAIFWHFVL
ncbi:MAG: alpha/beta hydrolase family protein [Armatimonadota bacterium]